MKYSVYVLQNPAGRFYIGQTDDLERRLIQHNSGTGEKSKYTIKHGPWEKVWWEEHTDRSSAMLRARQIKSMKSARWIRERLLSGEKGQQGVSL